MKSWWKFLFVAAVCGFVGYGTVFVALKRGMITQREEDRNFLDNLVQKQDQDDHQDGSVISAADQNMGEAGTMVASSKPVPRAELVINTEIVRRAELVVHSGRPNRSPLQRAISQKP